MGLRGCWKCSDLGLSVSSLQDTYRQHISRDLHEYSTQLSGQSLVSLLAITEEDEIRVEDDGDMDAKAKKSDNEKEKYRKRRREDW
jgi:hypothetical protein